MPSATPLTLPSPTDFTAGGLASVTRALMPLPAPPILMLTSVPALAHHGAAADILILAVDGDLGAGGPAGGC